MIKWDPSKTEKRVSSNVVYKGRVTRLERDEIIDANGNNTVRVVLRHPGAVVILPVLPNGDIIFIKQWRYAINQAIYELPAGTLEEGEETYDCAVRELAEETGYGSNLKLEKLGEIFSAPGFCDEVLYIYKATDVFKLAHHPKLDDEYIELEILSLEQAKKLVVDGTIRDAKTICTLFYLENITK